MKTYEFKPQNPFMHKTFSVEQCLPNSNSIHVTSKFLGSWTFNLNALDYETLCSKLERYCSSNEYLQDIFVELTPSQRELFLTPEMSFSFENEI